MPKSRKRKPRNVRRSTSGSPRRQPDLDELRPWIDVMVQADAAEREGDAALALQFMGNRLLGPDGKPFWRPWRLRALTQLVSFEQVLPGWVYSRWILHQALQDISEPAVGRYRQAVKAVSRVRGGQMDATDLDAIEAQCKVIDEDWVYRQAMLYEFGGLESFLKRASNTLIGKADRIRQWAGAPMGGYQLLGREPATVMWRDLETGERFVVANNGCGALTVPGEFVIGRRVPIDGGSMFESVPLLVPQAVADEVARTPAQWLDALARSNDAGVAIRTGGHTFDLLSDVPPAIWLYSLNGGQVETVTRDLVEPYQLAGRVVSCAHETLAERRVGVDDPESIDLWPCLAAAVLEPDVFLALMQVTEPNDREVLGQLSEALPDPASSVFRAVTESPRDAA